MTAQTIWKYALRLEERVEFPMPAGARVLCVQFQEDALVLWALVAPDAPAERRRFVLVGTGSPLPAAAGRYVGTVQQWSGVFVWHIFEEAANGA